MGCPFVYGSKGQYGTVYYRVKALLDTDIKIDLISIGSNKMLHYLCHGKSFVLVIKLLK